MKRKRDGFVPLGDVRRRYRYGRVARRLRPPPPAPRPFTRIRFRECFGQVQLRLAACARAYTRPTLTGETGARRTFHLKISTITAGHLATQVVAVRIRRIDRARASERDIRDLRRCKSCGDPDLAYCAGIGFVASGSYDEPSRH